MEMKLKLRRFQEDIRDGMKLEEALHKHQLSLKYAFNNMPKTVVKRGGNPTFIAPVGNKFLIRKTVNGSTKHFGTYMTLNEAVKVRDYCERHGWIKENLDKYCEELGVERVTKKGRKKQ